MSDVTASGWPLKPLENVGQFVRWFGDLGTPKLEGEAKGDRDFIHLRRGLALLLREVSSRYTPGDAVTFAFAVSDPAFQRDPERGAKYLESLADEPLMATLSIPLYCAAYAFSECASAKNSELGSAIIALRQRLLNKAAA